MRLANGLRWTLPITLAVGNELAGSIKEGDEVALVERTASGNRIVGTMHVSEKFSYDKQNEAQNVYRTTEAQHPGVANLYEQGDVRLAGHRVALPETERA